MISICPLMSFSQIFIVKPSGYCGANRSIRQIGTKKVAIKESEAIATIILSILVSLFICLFKMGQPYTGHIEIRKHFHLFFHRWQQHCIYYMYPTVGGTY